MPFLHYLFKVVVISNPAWFTKVTWGTSFAWLRPHPFVRRLKPSVTHIVVYFSSLQNEKFYTSKTSRVEIIMMTKMLPDQFSWQDKVTIRKSRDNEDEIKNAAIVSIRQMTDCGILTRWSQPVSSVAYRIKSFMPLLLAYSKSGNQ